MLTRVDVQSENPFYLNIRDARPTDSIIVEKIEGLSPPDINLFMGEYARDGGVYGGRRVPPRTVTFTLRLNPKYTEGESVSGLRLLLYKTFMDPFVTTDALNIILKSDDYGDRYIAGYVEKFDGDLFSDDTTVQITMRCPNPYIQDYNLTSETFLGPAAPFSYGGSAETGLLVSATLFDNSPFLTFDLNGTVFVLDYDFLANDVVTLNTVRGERSVKVLRGGVTTEILYAKTAASTWLELHAPSNIMSVYGTTEANTVANLTSLAYRPLHWGI